MWWRNIRVDGASRNRTHNPEKVCQALTKYKNSNTNSILMLIKAAGGKFFTAVCTGMCNMRWQQKSERARGYAFTRTSYDPESVKSTLDLNVFKFGFDYFFVINLQIITWLFSCSQLYSAIESQLTVLSFCFQSLCCHKQTYISRKQLILENTLW